MQEHKLQEESREKHCFSYPASGHLYLQSKKTYNIHAEAIFLLSGI